MIELQQVCAGYGGRAVLHEVSFTAPDGQVTALVGPNGSGKTTLLRVIAGQLPLTGGSISVNGHTAAENRRAFARGAAYLPQSRCVPAITVETLVGHGRCPYLGLSRRMRPADRQAVARAMALTGVDRWAARVLFAPFELPVGVLLSLVGGPFFLFLLLRRKRSRLYD